MRYEKLVALVQLAIRLQGRVGGMTIDDIRDEFGVSRRTAERMRDAVEQAFGPLLPVETADRRRHWRLNTKSLSGLIELRPEELVELESAASSLDRSGLEERASVLRELADKIRAARRTVSGSTFDDEHEVLLRSEGLAMRPGPRVSVQSGLLPKLRDAIRGSRKVAFDYVSRQSGNEARHVIAPYGILYGNRPYLVGRTDATEQPHLWLLTNMNLVCITDQSFEADEKFDLKEYSERSFGAYQEAPFDVAIRFSSDVASDAKNFSFHPSQTVHDNADGTLTVKFTAGGRVEMCHHLMTWGTSVEVEEPEDLREQLQGMCAELASHHAHVSE